MLQKYPIVTINITNYNERKFIFQAIDSAVNQNYPNIEIFITDNNSTDGTTEDIEKKIPKWEEKRREIMLSFGISEANLRITYIKNTENTGFGRPHNNAIRNANGEFILLLNADIILPSDYVENALKPFEDSKVGAVQGKLLRYNFDKNELCKDRENPQLNIIDTTGLMMFKNRRIVCIGQGQADSGQFEEEKEIFGADGAIPIYRKEALEDVKLPILEHNPRRETYKYEYFDEDFFMYKEDVDLAWRMRLRGWKTVYNPKAAAYHGRGSGDSMAKNYISIIKERMKINKRAKYFSFKHQRLMQIKNDFPSLLFVKHMPQFMLKEIGAWAYMTVFERFTFGILKDLYRDIPIFLKKRKIVMAGKRVGAKEMERWFE